MYTERTTQDRIVELFQQPTLGYTYLGNWEKEENSTNILEKRLTQFLTHTQHYAPALAQKAIFELKKTAALSSQDDLYPTNRAVYSLLRYGIKVRAEQGEPLQTIRLINWDDPAQNDFAFAQEVTIKGEKVKRPDLVLYLNGIAIAVLELKRASVSVTAGIRQNLDNQQNRFIKSFFSTIQFVLAGNDAQGLYYGTTKTPEKRFLCWKEDNFSYDPSLPRLDQHLLQFFDKTRLLDLLHNFVVFDAGLKKLCRPNQYFGVKAAQQFITRREGGIIWHTQGSGKSLTMVWLAKWIRENVADARLLIITDRTELDIQIEQVFEGVDEKIYRTRNARDLLGTLQDATPWLICTLIHKFGAREDRSLEEFIGELHRTQGFQPKGNLIVFIDECHRTQSGKLHDAMKGLLPDALFLGFTGTPLLKADKKTSIETFGPYIHTYRFDEAVADGVVLDLLYEARDVDQHVLDQAGIDEWFEAVTLGMNDLPKAELKRQWGTMQKVLSSKGRLEKIVFDIIKDFKIKPRLRDGQGNAMLVARSIYEACRYYEFFQNFNFKKCAIITSFEPNAQSTRGETTGEGDTEKIEQYEIYQRMLNGKSREEFERNAKEKFIKEPANMQLLIVVDKLLTGFDAPPCTYLYIDKEMRDHGLFQAICRVNRTENEDKDFGYIVDYKNLFDRLSDSITDYTSGAFDQYDQEDVQGLLTDRLQVARERLEDALEVMHQLCEPVAMPRNPEQYIHYFCGDTQDPEAIRATEQLRLTFYQSTVALIRAYNNVAAEMPAAGFTEAQAARIKQQVDHYTELRNTIKVASGDFIDLKRYEPEMRQLLDMYLTADPRRTISNFGDVTLLQLVIERGIHAAGEALPDNIRRSPSAMAETIEANMRQVIIQEMPINPIFYGRMSALLTDLVQQRRQAAIDYEQYLRELEELARDLLTHQTVSYPTRINSRGKKALFDALNEDETLTLTIDQAINEVKKDNWIGHTIKEREVQKAIKKYVPNDDEAVKIFNLVREQSEYR